MIGMYMNNFEYGSYGMKSRIVKSITVWSLRTDMD